MRSRIRFQYSTRTLFVLLTALALILGMYFQSVSRQKAAVAVVHSLGGSVAYDNRGMRSRWVPKVAVDQFDQDYFFAVTSINLGDMSMPRVHVFPDLEQRIHASEWTCGLSRVTSISLNTPVVSDSDMKHVASLRDLKDLTIGPMCAIGEAGIRCLGGHPSLESIRLKGSDHFTDATCDVLASIRTLRKIELVGGPHLTDAGLGALVRLPLEELGLFFAELTDEDVRALANVKTLRTLVVSSAKIRSPGRVQAYLDDRGIDFVEIMNGSMSWPPHALSGIDQQTNDLFSRHFRDDWGEAEQQLAIANAKGLVDGSEIRSLFQLANGDRVYVVTEAAPRDGRRGFPKIVPVEE